MVVLVVVVVVVVVRVSAYMLPRVREREGKVTKLSATTAPAWEVSWSEGRAPSGDDASSSPPSPAPPWRVCPSRRHLAHWRGSRRQ